jgi:hypothetical protein
MVGAATTTSLCEHIPMSSVRSERIKCRIFTVHILHALCADDTISSCIFVTQNKHGINNSINTHSATGFGFAEPTITQIIQPNVDTRNFRVLSFFFAIGVCKT